MSSQTSSVLKLLRSAIGQKAVMAVTGFVLFGFVLGHLAGNLKLYQGPEKLNAYAEWLREVGAPALPHGALLWTARAGLLLAVGLHIASAWRLTVLNRSARPHDYAVRQVVQASYAARTMRWGGVIVALFVVYHLAHFTWGFAWVHPDFVPGDVYHNVVAGLRVPWVAAFYVAAQVALGFHLHHGLWSMFQSLGWDHLRWNPWRERFAAVFALVIAAGNISFPVAVLAGWVR
jgi:succinate dehydrogenase / fumarate reductase cytochrome b subunit